MATESHLLTVEPGGVCVFDREPSNSMHSHRYWEICVVRRGTGEYIERGVIYPLQAGSLFASPPDVLHEIRSPITRDLELFFVSFTIRSSPTSVSSESDAIVEAFLENHHIALTDMHSMLPFGELISNAVTPNIANDLARIFTLEAMNRLGMSSAVSKSENLSSHDVERAMRFLSSQCNRPLTVQEVADHVAMSPRTLHRKFVTHFGHGVAKEIRQQKMRRAAHHLLMGYSVTEVAQSVGIVDASQFSAAFLAEIGSRPKAFQQTYLPGNFGKG